MADTMFFVLAKKWMYEGFTREETAQFLRENKYTEIPLEYLESKDPAIIAMVEAIKAGWNHDPKKRATAREISDRLSMALREIMGVDELGVVRVVIPPLPRDYRHTESDYWRNLN